MMLTTSASWTEPTGYFASMFSHGEASFCFRPERDLLLVLVDRQDLDLDLLVDLEDLARVIDPAPRHVGDVQQAVDAAEVDERAEVGDVLDGALDDLPTAQALERLLLQLFALLLDQLAAEMTMLRRSFVDLEDDRVDVRPIQSLISPGRRMSTCDAGRNTGTPMSTSRPPLIFLVTLPATGRPPSWTS
jgi:hypothetical protein